jgi:hypothetical protein
VNDGGIIEQPGAYEWDLVISSARPAEKNVPLLFLSFS